MSIQAITTKVISTLGNKESLVPITIKDAVDSGCLTYKSYKNGGKVEGIERGIDEFGTQAIWIGGIPLFKKIIDKTIYRHAKINPDVDPRILADSEYANWAKNNAKGLMSNNKSQTVQNAIKDCLVDGGKKTKNLYLFKVVTSTALTLAAFFLLTKAKQKKTELTIKKEMNESIKNDNNKFSNIELTKSDIFKVFEEKNKKSPSFKGIFKRAAEGIMFNPVHNMKIIDAGITTERLACSRNKTEFIEHAIKEGGFLFSVYGLGNLIEKGFCKISDKILKNPIDLNINVIMDNNLAKALKNKTITQDLSKFKNIGHSLTDKLNFLKNNPENILVIAAKKSGIISTVENNQIDTSKFIDMKQIDKLSNHLETIQSKFSISKMPIEKFLNKTKFLKVASVMTNMIASCIVLGYFIPKYIYNFRLNSTGTTKFHVAEDLKKNKDIQ